MTIIAIVAFVFTSKIQEKVTGSEGEWSGKSLKTMSLYAIIPLLVIALIAFTPSRDEYVMKQLEARLATGECKPNMIEADKLAFEVVNNYYQYNIVDVRSAAEYDSFHIATAVNIPLDKLAELEFRNFINQRIKINVFYASSQDDAKRACLIARFHGNASGLALSVTADEFKTLYYDIEPLPIEPTRKELMVHKFRTEAARKMAEIEASVASISKPIEKKTRTVQGGCS
jgi:rhodanese-related sulfurtransferase